MSAEHSLTLQENLHAPSQARAWVSARLAQVPRHVVEDAMLLVSELVTNAVRHGAPEIVVNIDLQPPRLRVEVRDGSAALPVVPPRPPSAERPAGRGLLIVAATASDWGVAQRPDGNGKTVWAELSLDEP